MLESFNAVCILAKYSEYFAVGISETRAFGLFKKICSVS